MQGLLKDIANRHLLAALIRELEELEGHDIKGLGQAFSLGATSALLFKLLFLLILLDAVLGRHALSFYTTDMDALSITDSSRVLVLTGAGVSAESGLATFRAGGGLWESHPVEQVASMEGFLRDPALVWKFYSERRKGALQVEPNPGHYALAKLEARLGERMLLTTQNVDGLHQRAGSRQMVELHGNLLMTRCLSCDRAPFPDTKEYYTELPECSECAEHGRSQMLRPHIVWFGEALDHRVLGRVQDFIEEAGEELIFLAIGTSGSEFPAAALVDAAKAVGGQTWLVNLDEAQNSGRFDHVVRGKSGDVLPLLLADD
jgi:NAD-dependent deacetylase